MSISSRQSAFADSLTGISPLKREEIESYINYIDEAVDNALCLINGLGNIRWQPVKQKGDVVISRAADDLNSLSNQAAVRSVCTVNASFDEMMEHLITETTEVFREREITLHGAEFLDGAVLHILQPRDYSSDYSSQRFVCIKWHSLKAVAAPTKPRDYVYVEVVDSFVDDQNMRIGYRLSKSIDLKFGLEDPNRFIRAKTFSLHTFHSLESPNPSRTSIHSSGSSVASPSSINSFQVELRSMVLGDYNGRLPAWVVNKMSDMAALRGQSIRDYFEQQRLNTLQWVQPSQYIPISKRSFCVICTRGFSLVRKKYNCQACGDVICNQCSIIQTVGAKKVKARVCIGCNIQARTNQLNTTMPSTISSRPSNASSQQSPMNQPNRSSVASLATTARASEKLSIDSSSFRHSTSIPDWPTSSLQPHPHVYRRSQSEMPSDNRGSLGPFTPSRDSNGRISGEHHRFTNSSTRTFSITSNTSSSRPSTQDIPSRSSGDDGTPTQKEGLDLGVDHFKQPSMPPMIPPSITTSAVQETISLNMDISILHPQQDLGRLSEALSDITARNSELTSDRMSERISELDVDAYDDMDEFTLHQDTVLEETGSEVSLDFSSFVNTSLTASSTSSPDEDDMPYRPSQMAEDYLEATRMTLAEINRGMQSVQESTEMNGIKIEEQVQEQVRMSVMDHTPFIDEQPGSRMSVMEAPPDVENLFAVLKLNAEIDRLQHKMETVQESTIQLNHANEAINEKIHTLEKIENKKAARIPEIEELVVISPANEEPPIHLVNAMDKISKDLKAMQQNMELVQENTLAIDLKLQEKESDIPQLPESVRGFEIFLEDSSFAPAPASDADPTPDGWTSVHSKVSGKMYYYNASRGKTSWTMPEEDDMAITENYAVL